jgi:pimeloyl-ACP methyl ester carboxylesterase
VQSFQESATHIGTVVAPQGEILCGAGPYSTLSGDIKQLNQRIVDAFAALAIPEVRDAIVVGYSLGASRALALARLYPERYTRLVLIAAPAAPTPWGLKGIKRTVMLAGSRDRKDLMRRGVFLMQQANIPSTFLELPGANHGQMGDDAERVMAEALRFVLE